MGKKTQTQGTISQGKFRPEYDPKLWESDSDDEHKATVITRFKIDYLVNENRMEHHTDRFYDMPNLIVRRGQEFRINLTCDNFDLDKDRVVFQFRKTGMAPQINKGTLKNVKIYKDKAAAEKELDKHEWCGYMSRVEGGNLTIAIKTNVEAVVGSYSLRLVIYDDVGDKVNTKIQQSFQEKDIIYVLFNPWHKDDQVYIEGEAEKQEYVLNDLGEIFVGTAKANRPRMWYFDPCATASLKVATYLLQEKLKSPDHHLLCTNATAVCRVLCSLMSSEVILTNFSAKDKDYPEDTKKPNTWSGSRAILEQYLETKQPVKYGTDITLSGVLTTLCRALGIPCRSVTSFETASDTDGSLTIDFHYYGWGKNEGREMAHLNKDCVWESHVWNEAWFLRPDLPDGYGGWQAFDSTPIDSGKVRCGPTSAKAIKEGDLYLDYETRSFFSKLNGDEVLWYVNKDGDMEVIDILKDSVGKNFITNSSDGSRLDVTNNYKYPEGSEEERRVASRASQYSFLPCCASKVYKKKETDCVIEVSKDINKASDIMIFINIENKSSQPRTVDISVTANVKYFTGRVGEEVFTSKLQCKVPPGQKKSEGALMKALCYFNQIDEDALMEVHTFAKVAETSQREVFKETILVDIPELELTPSNEFPKKGEKFTLTIQMTNTLEVPLENVSIKVDGPGLGIVKSLTRECKNVPAEGKFVEKVDLVPELTGPRYITVVFNCKQVKEVIRSKRVVVA